MDATHKSSERALVAVIQEAYVTGSAPGWVDELMQAMGMSNHLQEPGNLARTAESTSGSGGRERPLSGQWLETAHNEWPVRKWEYSR